MLKHKFLFTSFLIVLTLSFISATPSYDMNTTNNTGAGLITLFSINVTDDVALHPDGMYIFSTNNTGGWLNDSAINFTVTPSWANVTKTLNSTAWNRVDYLWYFNDSAGNTNSTPVYTLTTTDLTDPYYTEVSINNTVPNKITLFSINVTDETELSPNGQYIFATNNSGSWVNDTAINFTSISEWANVTKTLNSTEDFIVGYRWYFNDTAGNVNTTPIYILTTNDLTPPTYSLPSVNNTYAGHLSLFTLLVNDNIRLNNNGMYIFSTNSTGIWVNNSGVNFAVTPSSTETTYTLNSTKNTLIGYRWYMNDSFGNRNSTPIYTLTTVEYVLAGGFASTYDSPMGTVKNVTCYYVSSDLECLSKNLLYDCDANYFETEDMCLEELEKINQQPVLIRDLRLNALYFGGKFLPSNPFLGFLLLLLIIYGVVKVFIIGKGKLGLKNQKRKVFK